MDKRFLAVMKEAGLLASSDSLDALRDMVRNALRDVCCACSPMADDCECSVPCKCDDCWIWMRDIFPDQVVYEMSGQLFQRSYAVANKTVTFGSPTAVEIAYKPLGESHREIVRESVNLKEAGTWNSSKGELTITVIRPGMNTSKTRFYAESTLKRDHKIFEGAKMFANHQTATEEKTRPEGDVNQWVANISKTWAESDGTVKAAAIVVDPPFKAKLDRLNEAGLLNEMGVSIRAVGRSYPAEVEGVQTTVVESFLGCRSVDFVTYPGAGGRVEAIESDRNDVNDVDLVNVSQLRERRPDLIEIIESNAQRENMKTIEQQLQESTAALAAEKLRADKAVADLAEANKNVAKAQNTAVLAELNTKLTESKLPEAAQTKIRTAFKEATTTEGIAEAIKAELDYIASVTGQGVKNLGASHTTETRESAAGNTKKVNLAESFALLPGLSKEEAAIAGNFSKR